MNSGQEGKDRTKIRIHNVIFPKFGESEIHFFLFPPVLQSSGHVSSIIIPQNKSNGVLIYPFKGHLDWPILSRVKGGVKMSTSYE